MRIIYIVCNFILLLLSCQQFSRYKEELVRQGAELSFLSHMPDIDGTNYSYRFNFKPENNFVSDQIVYVYLEIKIDSKELSKIKNNSIESYKPLDSCNVIPFIHQESTLFKANKGNEWKYKKIQKIWKSCSKTRTYYPIPSFIGVGDNEFKYVNGLPAKYQIFVLESKSGKHFNDKYYGTVKPIMPVGWDNGFSKGVAVNQEDLNAIYWFILW